MQYVEKNRKKASSVVPSSGATGVFRAATGVAAAPQRGANPSFFPRFALKAAKPSARRRAEGCPKDGVVARQTTLDQYNINRL